MRSFKNLKPILNLIENNIVTKIVGPSGIGKTTILPMEISSKLNMNIFVVVSNSIAADSLNEYKNTNKVVYITSYDMKNLLYTGISNELLQNIDLIFIDETDKSSADNFIIMSLWRYYVENRGYQAKLLLTSNNLYEDLFPNDPTYIIPDNSYNPVQIRYISNGNGNNNDNNGNGNKSETSYDLENGVSYLDKDLVSKTINIVYDLHNSSLEGDILIFTLDEFQVKSIATKLTEIIPDAKVYQIHPNISEEEINKLYSCDTSDSYNIRKIYVSTDLTETTITLNNISTVIDMMLELRVETTPTGGIRHLVKHISKDRADRRANRTNQRANRTNKRGRKRINNQNNICYRIISESSYNMLPDTTIEEIFRIPTHLVMLEILDNGLDPMKILDMYSKKDLKRDYNLMLKFGVINVVGKITKLGKFCLQLPFGLRQSVALWRYNKLNKPLFPAIVLLSMIDNVENSYYSIPIRKSDESIPEFDSIRKEFNKTYLSRFTGKDDIETYSNIWSSMLDDLEGFNSSSNDLRKWCNNNGLDFNQINLVKMLIESVIDKMDNYLMNDNDNDDGVVVGPFTTQGIMKILSPILKDIYSDKVFTLNNDNNGNDVVKKYIPGNKENKNNKDNKTYTVDSVMSLNTIDTDGPEKVYGLITSTINSNVGNFNTLVCSLI